MTVLMLPLTPPETITLPKQLPSHDPVRILRTLLQVLSIPWDNAGPQSLVLGLRREQGPSQLRGRAMVHWQTIKAENTDEWRPNYSNIILF